MSGPRFVGPPGVPLVDRRTSAQRAPFQRRKADTIALIEALYALGFTPQQMAQAMHITDRRVRQVMELLRLGQPTFPTLGEAMTWLASERPELELRLRYYRFGKESDSAKAMAAA